MTLLQCDCGSVKWTVVADFSVGWTVPTTTLRSHIARSEAHPEQEPKCTACGAPMPTFSELLEKRLTEKRGSKDDG